MGTYEVVLEEESEVAAGPRARRSPTASGLHTAEGFAEIEDGMALVQPEPAPDAAEASEQRPSRMAGWLAALLAACP